MGCDIARDERSEFARNSRGGGRAEAHNEINKNAVYLHQMFLQNDIKMRHFV